MPFLPVILWSDVLIWLLLVGAIALGVLSARKPLLAAAWRRVRGGRGWVVMGGFRSVQGASRAPPGKFLRGG